MIQLFHLVLPMDQKSHTGAHQEDGASHSDGTPVRSDNGVQDLTAQQEAQPCGDPFRQQIMAAGVIIAKQMIKSPEGIKEDNDRADDLNCGDAVTQDLFKALFDRCMHGQTPRGMYCQYYRLF